MLQARHMLPGKEFFPGQAYLPPAPLTPRILAHPLWQAQINHVETAYTQINHALTMALTRRKPVYISIASNVAAAYHPSLAQEPILFK